MDADCFCFISNIYTKFHPVIDDSIKYIGVIRPVIDETKSYILCDIDGKIDSICRNAAL